MIDMFVDYDRSAFRSSHEEAKVQTVEKALVVWSEPSQSPRARPFQYVVEVSSNSDSCA
jgi:hypothetical protein